MRNTIHVIMALAIALTCWPTDGFSQSNMWRQQQMMQQQRMQQENMRRQQEIQRQQRETQRRQQEAQRRQMEEQRRRQQVAMQQRQREMQVRKQQMQAQRQKMAEQRRLQQQKRQQEIQRKQVQRQQVAQKQAQQTARIARDRALQQQRERRLLELRKRTLLQQQQQQEQQRQKAAQQTSTIALLSRTTNRASMVSSQNFAQRRQESAQRFAKLRASRPVATAAGGAGSGGRGNNKAIIVANKQFQQQKLQEFRNRQALRGPKDTKQDFISHRHFKKHETLGRGTAADALLKKSLPSQFYGQVRKAFDGEIKAVRLKEPMVMYRTHGGVSGEKGRWMTRIPFKDPVLARKRLALPADNPATKHSKFVVPAGTIIYVGKTAAQPQFGKHATGGAEQVFVPNIDNVRKIN